jgi:hypothetical protein
MERIVRKSRDRVVAQEWDIDQQISMTASDRLRAARILKTRVYGRETMDVREWHRSGLTAATTSHRTRLSFCEAARRQPGRLESRLE